MKVLMQGRSKAGERRGGDATLAANVARELEQLGHEVVLASRPPEGGAGPFDVVHAINLDRSVLAETEAFARAAMAAGKRLVITPLWWPLDGYIASLPSAERLAFRAKGLAVVRALHGRDPAALRGVRRRQGAILRAAGAVCATGMAESAALQDAFGTLALSVIALGTNRGPEAPRADDPPSPERSGVLCVARLDPRKNQLGLIQALGGTGIPLRLVGTGQIFPAYAQRCRAAAAGTVEFSGFVADDELIRAYRQARVHALPSVFELPGLVSLDAASLGAAVVVSRAGTAGDYFGPDASYAGIDPGSIREAVLEAYQAGPPPGLAGRIAAAYPWRNTAAGYLAVFDPA